MILLIAFLALILLGCYCFYLYQAPSSYEHLFRKIQISGGIKGQVVHGMGRARIDLGYPTANIRINPEDYPKTIKLRCGIYILEAQIPGYPNSFKGYARLNERKSHFFVYFPAFHHNQKKINLYDLEVKLSQFQLVSAQWIDFIQVYHNFLDLIHGFPYVKTAYF